MSPTRPRHRRIAAAVSALALLVAGCATANDAPSETPPGEEPLPPVEDGDAAGDTTMRVYSVSEARAAGGEGSLHVTGLLIDEGSGWRLCGTALESYPPQCGGESLSVDGLDPSLFPLEQEGEVRWQDGATLVGEVDGDTLTVTGSAASS